MCKNGYTIYQRPLNFMKSFLFFLGVPKSRIPCKVPGKLFGSVIVIKVLVLSI